MFIAYNITAGQWLCRDDNQTWCLTPVKSDAYQAKTADRLIAIGKAQKNRMPNTWDVQRVDTAASQVKTDKKLEQASRQHKRNLTHMILDPHTVCGEWDASDEYNAVLEAINTLSQYAARSYGTALHERLSDLNNEMVDIEHFIELNTMTKAKASDMANRIQSVMRQRRNVQQQLQLINRIYSCRSIDDLLDGHFEKPSAKVAKKYNPRSSNGKTIFHIQ